MDAGFRELLSSVDHGDINDGIKEVWRTTSGDIGKLIKALLPGSQPEQLHEVQAAIVLALRDHRALLIAAQDVQAVAIQIALVEIAWYLRELEWARETCGSRA